MRLKASAPCPWVVIFALGCSSDLGTEGTQGNGGRMAAAGATSNTGGKTTGGLSAGGALSGGSASTTGGNTASGGASTGGSTTGGAASGGNAPSGGTGTGGVATGGVITGGARTGGAPNGGSSTGGGPAGGSGGKAAGGTNAGGAATGGTSTGGTTTGGTSTGGLGSGGTNTGGTATGGTSTGGLGSGGTSTGGRTTGGAPTGGQTATGGAGASGGTAGGACPSTGHVTYTLARAAQPTAQEQAAYDKIVPAMETAISYYNCHTSITKSLNVSYVPSVATADGNSNGSIRFGSTASMNHITAMHEISHTVGIGTYSEYGALVSNSVFQGTNATTQLLAIPERTRDTVGADTQHFWPYGLNYTTEVTSNADLIYHCLMVVAIRKDMGY